MKTKKKAFQIIPNILSIEFKKLPLLEVLSKTLRKMQICIPGFNMIDNGFFLRWVNGVKSYNLMELTGNRIPIRCKPNLNRTFAQALVGPVRKGSVHGNSGGHMSSGERN